VLAWCVLQVVAEAIDAENWDRIAVDLFDRLRLREPLAQAFHSLGLEGEEGWRGAARLKALLLVQSGAGMTSRAKSAETGAESKAMAPDTKEQRTAESAGTAKSHVDVHVLAVPPALWGDPDICWLTGAHVAESHTYLVRESYEQLLWWLTLPRLMRLAEAPAPHRADAAMLLDDVDKALVALEGSGYRLDELLEPEEAATAEPAGTPKPQKEALETVPKTGPQAGPDPEQLEPQEPVTAKPVGPKNPEGPPEEY
jgi:hypothetical protein